MGIPSLLNSEIVAINIGLDAFAQALEEQHIKTVRVAWKPPAGGDREIIALLAGLEPVKEKIEAANRRAVEILLSADPIWTGVGKALDVLEGMTENTILHSGPPIAWESMVSIQRRGVIRGVVYEGLARSEEEALEIIEQGRIKLGAASDYSVVGSGVGIITPSMALNICENKITGAKGYCPLWEGREGLGTWGCLDESITRKLKEFRTSVGPGLNAVLQEIGGLPLKGIIARALEMGDEIHTRQVACGLFVIQAMMPHILASNLAGPEKILCIENMIKTDRWFHSLGMASSQCQINSIKNIPYCSIITGMAGNGVHFGIKVSSLGERWFNTPAPEIRGMFLSSRWSQEDAIPWLGESCVTESVGLGGLAAAAAPLVLRLRGQSSVDGLRQTREMKAICAATNDNYPIPALNFEGPPVGIDIIRIMETGITPALHGGIISKQGGQIGAGTGRVPLDCVKAAFKVFVEEHCNSV